jgi:STE24 endopeptidase
LEKLLFYIIIAIIVFDFLFDRIIDYLNASRWSNKLPDELKGIYDEEKYRKSQDYFRVNLRFGTLTSSLSFVLILAFLLLGGFQFLDAWVRQITEHPILMALLFFGVIGIASDILSTPFSIYDTFVIEEKFGFNRTTVKTFITDKIKGWLLAALLGGGLLAIFVWFYDFAGSLFWLYAWLFLTGFSVFMAMFYSTLIVPLFNKQKPLEEGELRDAIEAFSQKAGFKLDNIFVIDGSKRSSKANAYFSGLGPKKRIVLFDTLIKDHTTQELVAILAHEIGHYKKKHIVKGMVVSGIHSVVMLYLLGFFINRPELSMALGVEQSSFHIGIIAFGLLYSPISTILGIAGNAMSRKHEYQADSFAARNYKPEPLQDALKKLSVNNLSNLRPHPLHVFINYSHPTLLQRLEHLEKFKVNSDLRLVISD